MFNVFNLPVSSTYTNEIIIVLCHFDFIVSLIYLFNISYFYRYLSEGFQVIIEKSKDAKCSLKDVQLRFLCPDDLEEVRKV